MAAGTRIADLGSGVLQVTHRLPWALDHVHCYLVCNGGAATIVDCGLGTSATLDAWRSALVHLGQPAVGRLVLTHYHPDHVGAAAGLVELAGIVEVVEGRLDATMAKQAWGAPEGSAIRDFLLAHGMPAGSAARSSSDEVRLAVGLVEPSQLVDEGDSLELGGEIFDVLVLPGHADGHVALLGRESRRLFGGDVILGEITPNIGRWPGTAPDPLGRYFETLERLTRIAPAIVYPGHGPVIRDVAGRAAQIRSHHEDRLRAVEEALACGPCTAYEVARTIWPADALGPHEERFALGEALAHLEHLEARGRARAVDANRWMLAG